jgi:hypothetical protein
MKNRTTKSQLLRNTTMALKASGGAKSDSSYSNHTAQQATAE